MPRKFISKQRCVKIALALAVSGSIISTTGAANAGIFESIWQRVVNTVYDLKDGVQLNDFRPLVSDLLNTVPSPVWQVIKDQSGVDLKGVIYDVIFYEKAGVLAKIERSSRWIENSTFSADAVANMERVSRQIGENLEKTIDLGQQVQGDKVTQEILKKISLQEALAAERDSRLIQQNQLEQIDRAVGNQLSSSILGELLSSNISAQRQAAAATVSAIETSALIGLPGFVPNSSGTQNQNAALQAFSQSK